MLSLRMTMATMRMAPDVATTNDTLTVNSYYGRLSTVGSFVENERESAPRHSDSFAFRTTKYSSRIRPVGLVQKNEETRSIRPTKSPSTSANRVAENDVIVLMSRVYVFTRFSRACNTRACVCARLCIAYGTCVFVCV